MLGKPNVCIALACGRGRLSPLDDQCPPLLMPFLNRSLLWYLLRACRRAGLDSVLLLLDEPAIPIELLKAQSAGLPMRVDILHWNSPERKERLRELLHGDDPVLLMQNPGLDLLPLEALLDFHQAQQADCSLRLSPVAGYRSQPVCLDGEHQVLPGPCPPGSKPGFDARCYLIEPDIFEALIEQEVQLLRQPLLPVLLEAAQYVSGLLSEALWQEWQQASDYFDAQRQILAEGLIEPAHQRLLRAGNATIWAGEDVLIDPSVSISGPVAIGDQVLIEAGVRIQGPVTIGSRVRIQARSEIVASWLWPGCEIGSDCRLKQSWLGEAVCLGAGSRLDRIWVARGSRLQLASPLPPGTILGPRSIMTLT